MDKEERQGKRGFIKEALVWIKGRKLVLQETNVEIRHLNKVIANLHKQIAATEEHRELIKAGIVMCEEDLAKTRAELKGNK